MQDLKDAMRRGDAVAAGALRMLRSQLAELARQKRADALKENPAFSAEEADRMAVLSEDEVLACVGAEAKKRREAIEGFEKGGAAERAAQERAELAVLSSYLPEQMTEDEVRNVVREAVASSAASGLGDIGRVMAAAMANVKGRADGKLVQKIARELLS